MAIFSSTATGVADKSLSVTFPAEAPSLINGLVQHALITPSAQVQILSIVDASAGATLGDIVIELPDHPDPVGAVMLLVDAGVLAADIEGTLDAFTVIRRAGSRARPEPEIGGSGTPVPPQGGDAPSHGSTGIDPIETSPFSASVFIGSGDQRRAFARLDAMRRPGAYILMNETWAYVGTGGDVGARIAHGRQPIDAVDTVVALVDTHDTMSPEEAKALERILWSRVAGSGERELINDVPDGQGIDPERYSYLDAMAGQACLALRHRGILFTGASTRSVLAGPRAEPERTGALRPFNAVPNGEVFEMSFGDGLVALAAKQAENHWLLLRGSEVRIETAASANASVRYLRAAWLHSGLLAASPDGKSYTVMRDLVFASGSAAAQFCCGSKSRGLSGWTPIDPDGGYDPDTPSLIAS